MTWEVEFTDQFNTWWESLTLDAQTSVAVGVDKLIEIGPGLGRPYVDGVKDSRHHHMKELRSVGGFLRVLFAFDPHRTAILLIGGDKTDRWREWYDETIPIADDLYDEHLVTIQREKEGK